MSVASSSLLPAPSWSALYCYFELGRSPNPTDSPNGMRPSSACRVAKKRDPAWRQDQFPSGPILKYSFGREKESLVPFLRSLRRTWHPVAPRSLSWFPVQDGIWPSPEPDWPAGKEICVGSTTAHWYFPFRPAPSVNSTRTISPSLSGVFFRSRSPWCERCQYLSPLLSGPDHTDPAG